MINKDILSTINFLLFILLIISIIGFTYWFLVSVYPIKMSIENLDKISLLTQNYQVNWLYSCPDYVQDYYTCNTTRFINMSGKYCGQRLTCENKFIIINRTQ